MIVLLENRNCWNVFLSIPSKNSYRLLNSYKMILSLFSAGARYSTFAVNIFKHTAKIEGKSVEVEFWDTGILYL